MLDESTDVVEPASAPRVDDANSQNPVSPAIGDESPGFLGPAEVMSISRRGVQVRLEGGTDEVTAELAYTFPYRPQPGDKLLVLGDTERFYAVGVLTGSGPANLAFQGDVDVQAVGGTLTLAGDHGVQLDAPKVTVRAAIFRVLAGSMVEKADNVYRWVKGLIAVRAGESRRTVDGEDSTRCEDSVTLAKGTVKLDGDQLHLGH